MQTPSSSDLSNATENQTLPAVASNADSMEDFYRLQRQLLKTTLVFSTVIFVSTGFVYSLHTALNYLIGACTGVVYLRMLSKNVERIGRGAGVSSGRLALVAALILVASQWNQLEIMPVFLGFLTYKAALIGYTIWAAIPHES